MGGCCCMFLYNFFVCHSTYSYRLHMSQRNMFPPTFQSSMVVAMDVYQDLGLEVMQGQGHTPPLLINLATWCNLYQGCFHSLETCLESMCTLSHHLLHAATLSLLFARHLCPLPFLPSLHLTLSFDHASVTLRRRKALIWLCVNKLWSCLISPQISSPMYTTSQKRMSHAHVVVKNSNWFYPDRSFPHFLAYKEHMVAVLYILQVNKILENCSSMRHTFKKMPCDIDVTFFFGG